MLYDFEILWVTIHETSDPSYNPSVQVFPPLKPCQVNFFCHCALDQGTDLQFEVIPGVSMVAAHCYYYYLLKFADPACCFSTLLKYITTAIDRYWALGSQVLKDKDSLSLSSHLCTLPQLPPLQIVEEITANLFFSITEVCYRYCKHLFSPSICDDKP